MAPRSAPSVPSATAAVGRAAPAVRPGLRGQPRRYAIEPVAGTEVLAEYRTDDENPFRCPRPAYDALARVLRRTTTAVKYAELTKLLGRDLKPAQADYQVRVALRFWGDRSIGLIERVRARYAPGDAKVFEAAAKQVWRRLKEGG